MDFTIAPNRNRPIRVIALAQQADFLLLLFSEVLRLGADADYQQIDMPEELAELVRTRSYDLAIGFWNGLYPAAEGAALVLRESSPHLRSVLLKSYGGTALLAITSKGDREAQYECDRLVMAIDNTFRGLAQRAAAGEAGTEEPSQPAPAVAADASPSGTEIGMAHDLNDVLTVILGSGEVLLGRLRHDSPGTHYAQELLAAARRASGLAADLMTVVYPQKRGPLELGREIAAGRSSLRMMAGGRLSLTIRMCPDPLLVGVDRRWVETVTGALVVHARLALPRGGELELSLDQVRTPFATISAWSGPKKSASMRFSYGPRDTPFPNTADTIPPEFATRQSVREIGLTAIYGLIAQAQGQLVFERARNGVTTLTVLLPLRDWNPPPGSPEPDDRGNA